MTELTSPVSIKQVFTTYVERESDSIFSHLVVSPKTSTLETRLVSRVSSLEKCFNVLSDKSDDCYTLTYSNQVTEQLKKLKNVILIAPMPILTTHCPNEALIKRNVIIVASCNPRLTFVKALKEIEKYNQLEDKMIPMGSGLISDGYVDVGKGCLLKQGAIVGQGGFGFERDGTGKPIRFPHFGRVIIGTNVEIGTNTVISRGAIENTEIGSDTKIDDLVYIAHNCKIGSRVMIAGNATLCGSVRIGDNAWIGAGATIKQHISIGEGAIIGLGAVVVKDVPPFVTVLGNPAKEYLSQKQYDE